MGATGNTQVWSESPAIGRLGRTNWGNPSVLGSGLAEADDPDLQSFTNFDDYVDFGDATHPPALSAPSLALLEPTGSKFVFSGLHNSAQDILPAAAENDEHPSQIANGPNKQPACQVGDFDVRENGDYETSHTPALQQPKSYLQGVSQMSEMGKGIAGMNLQNGWGQSVLGVDDEYEEHQRMTFVGSSASWQLGVMTEPSIEPHHWNRPVVLAEVHQPSGIENSYPRGQVTMNADVGVNRGSRNATTGHMGAYSGSIVDFDTGPPCDSILVSAVQVCEQPRGNITNGVVDLPMAPRYGPSTSMSMVNTHSTASSLFQSQPSHSSALMLVAEKALSPRIKQKQNRSNPKLGSNLSGKTAALKGEVPRGATRRTKRKRSQVRSWPSKATTTEEQHPNFRTAMSGLSEIEVEAMLKMAFELVPNPTNDNLIRISQLTRLEFAEVQERYRKRAAWGKTTVSTTENTLLVDVTTTLDSAYCSLPYSFDGTQPPSQVSTASKDEPTASRSRSNHVSEYQCTWKNCNRRFPNSYEGGRHELTHYPRQWACILPEADDAKRLPNDKRCPECGQHFIDVQEFKRHNHLVCPKAGEFVKKFAREDKLQEHLDKHHGGFKVPSDPVSAGWCLPGGIDFDKQCGFCGETMLSWDSRRKHIDKHYKDKPDLNVSSWRYPDHGCLPRMKGVCTKPDGDDKTMHEVDIHSDSDSHMDDSDDDVSGSGSSLGSPPWRKDPDSDGGSSSGGSNRRPPSDCQEQYRRDDRGRKPPQRDNGSRSNGRTRCGAQTEDWNSQPLLLLKDRIPFTLFSLRALGKGAYGSVEEVIITTPGIHTSQGKSLRGNSTLTLFKQPLRIGSPFVRKTITLRYQHRLARLTQAWSEVEIMARLNHPHIPKLLGASIQSHSLSIFMLPVAESNLRVFLNRQHFPLTNLIKSRLMTAFSCLSSALSHVHLNQYCHMDIKPENILVRGIEDERGNNWFLSDFGISTIQGSSSDQNSRRFTPMYAAPEVHHNDQPGLASDIWSLGCIFLEVVTVLHNHPIKDLQKFLAQTVSLGSPKSSDLMSYQSSAPGIHEWLNQLSSARSTLSQPSRISFLAAITDMLNVDPAKRPTAAELCERFAPSDCCSSDDPNPVQNFQEWSLPSSMKGTEFTPEKPYAESLLILNERSPSQHASETLLKARPLGSQSVSLLSPFQRSSQKPRHIEDINGATNNPGKPLPLNWDENISSGQPSPSSNSITAPSLADHTYHMLSRELGDNEVDLSLYPETPNMAPLLSLSNSQNVHMDASSPRSRTEEGCPSSARFNYTTIYAESSQRSLEAQEIRGTPSNHSTAPRLLASSSTLESSHSIHGHVTPQPKGINPVYYCAFECCSYSTHDFSDLKRHEGSKEHLSQRPICTQCSTTKLDEIGAPICEFCLIPFSQLGGIPGAHYLQCLVASKKVKTFATRDKLINHIQKKHGMEKNGQPAATSKKALIASVHGNECTFRSAGTDDLAPDFNAAKPNDFVGERKSLSRSLPCQHVSISSDAESVSSLSTFMPSPNMPTTQTKNDSLSLASPTAPVRSKRYDRDEDSKFPSVSAPLAPSSRRASQASSTIDLTQSYSKYLLEQTAMGKRIDRINLLYTGRDGPRYPGFTTPPVALPIQIQRPSRQTPVPIASPTFSVTSTASAQSRSTNSRSWKSSASSTSSVSGTPPWHPKTSDQHPAVTPYNYGYDLPCEFDFLGCNLRFHPEKFEAWISHSASHFVGVSPPSYAICTFCDSSTGCFRSQGDPYSNWRRRMIHIGSHFQNLEGERGLRPDFWVIQHMRSNEIISEDQFALAMKYSERPHCKSIAPYGHEIPEASLKKKELWLPYDLGKGLRQKRTMAKGKAPSKVGENARLSEPTASVNK